MKNIQKIIFLSLVAACCLSSNIFAQAESKEKKEIVIIKKVIDENGVESEEKIVLKGAEADKYIKEQGIKISKTNTDEGEMEVTVTVDAEDADYEEMNIWISDDGEEHQMKSGDKVMFFDINGKELPDDIKQLLIEKGVDLDELLKEGGASGIKTESQYKVVEIDDEGNKKVIEWNGEGDMPAEIKEAMGKANMDSDSKTIKKKVIVVEEDTDVDLNMEQSEGMRTIKIKKNKAGEESMEVIEWNGEEEIPQEVKDLLKEHNIDLENISQEGKTRMRIEKEIDSSMDESHEDHDVQIVTVHMHDEPQNKAQLGVMIEDGNSGVVVSDLIEGGAAKSAGVLVNDIITKVNKTKVVNSDDLIKALSDMEPGDKVTLTVFRNGELEKIKLNLQAPAAPTKSDYRTEHKVLKIKGGDINTCSPDISVVEWENDLTEEEVEIVEELILEEQGSEVDIRQQENTLELSTIDLFPNPTDGNIRLRFFVESQDATNVKVIDLAGRTIYEKNIENFDGSFDEEIDLPKTKVGTLVLVISQGTKVFTEKIILN